nr:putative ATP-dependent RNA helicase TDRD9 [Columba livia]
MRWEPRVAAIMLRQLTEEQIRDWFTIGKAVTDVEFLGEEAQAGTLHGPPCSPPSPFAAREPLMAVGLPSVGTEYADKYKQGTHLNLISGKYQDPVVQSPRISEYEDLILG